MKDQDETPTRKDIFDVLDEESVDIQTKTSNILGRNASDLEFIFRSATTAGISWDLEDEEIRERFRGGVRSSLASGRLDLPLKDLREIIQNAYQRGVYDNQ